MGPKFKHKIHLFSYIPHAQSLKGSFVDCFSCHLCFDYGLADGVRCEILHGGIVPNAQMLQTLEFWLRDVHVCDPVYMYAYDPACDPDENLESKTGPCHYWKALD